MLEIYDNIMLFTYLIMNKAKRTNSKIWQMLIFLLPVFSISNEAKFSFLGIVVKSRGLRQNSLFCPRMYRYEYNNEASIHVTLLHL